MNAEPTEKAEGRPQSRGDAEAAREQILTWLVNGRVGLSSKTMATIALGRTPQRNCYPYDPDDLNRCLLLLRAAPCVRDAFPLIANSSKVWAALIAQWDEIEATFLDEAGLDWCKSTNARKTYDLMKQVIESANKRSPAV